MLFGDLCSIIIVSTGSTPVLVCDKWPIGSLEIKNKSHFRLIISKHREFFQGLFGCLLCAISTGLVSSSLPLAKGTKPVPVIDKPKTSAHLTLNLPSSSPPAFLHPHHTPQTTIRPQLAGIKSTISHLSPFHKSNYPPTQHLLPQCQPQPQTTQHHHHHQQPQPQLPPHRNNNNNNPASPSKPTTAASATTSSSQRPAQSHPYRDAKTPQKTGR